MKKIYSCIWILFFFVFKICASDLSEFTFAKISPEGGVGYSSVMCIGQDDLSFIWFGTNNGLFKYDSKNITRYATNSSDSSAIPTNRINQFYLDNSKVFWIATENGLCKYNRCTDSFTTLRLINNQRDIVGKNIQSFLQDEDGQFWIVDEIGVCKLDTSLNSVEYFPVTEDNVRVNRGYTDHNKQLWVTAYDGRIYRFDSHKQDFVLFSKGLRDTPRALLVDDSGVWVGYGNQGLVCLSLTDGEEMFHYQYGYAPPYCLSNSKVRDLTKDLKGNIWVATYDGINIINNYHFVTSLSDEDLYNIPHQSIWSFFNDSENNIWVGTWMGGLCMYDEYMNTVYHYNKNALLSTLTDDVISCFAEGKDEDIIWFGTERGGVYCLNLKNNDLERIRLGQLSDVNVKSIAIDKENTIWIGTYGNGIWYKKSTEKNFSLFDSPHQLGWQIVDITPTDEGIWFANYSQGVLFYSFETKKTRSYKHSSRDLYSISNDYVRNIISDSQGNIWIATISGLNKYVPSEDKFYRFFKKENDTNSLSNDFIYSVQEDEDGIIWIGTNGNGLNRYNPEYNKFEVLTMEDGLSGNEVYAIVLDDNGLLWISTENGITSINTVSLETRNMTSEAGIYNNKFNPSAGYKSKSGELFFGGSNGFIRFSPFMIRTNPVAPIAIISHFSINNREVMPNTIGSVLKDHISNTREIRLHHRQNSFSFDFVASNYLFPSKNKFRYRLLGFDEEWLETDFVGKAIYTNISPGKYVFEVLAANNDEVWNHEPTSLAIVVSPPLWKRWYAFLFYLITIVVLAYLIRVEIISKEKLKNEVTIEKIHLENEKKLSQLKLQFFTNISHEFRTPLTLILGPVERLLKSYAGEDQVADQLTIVRNNALRLLKLVTQIIDFRKVETGKMELEMVDVNIVDLCSDIYNSFKEHARYRNIAFSMDVDMSQISIKIDKDKFDKILFNLLSNAFKNTPDNGVIKLVMRKNAVYGKDMFKDSFVIGKMLKGDYLEVSVHDNGCGIARDDLSRIFDRFYHGKEGKYANVGIGLSLTKELVNMMQGRLEVYTEEKKGSVFAVQFAIDSNVRFDHQTLLSEMSNGWDKGGAPAEWESVDLNGNIKHKDALVLIVEDNVELCDFISEVLHPYFKTVKAPNGKVGIEYAQTIFPDIIVSDVMMPEMDGCELCQQIKNDIKTSHIPVILLTALNSVQDKFTGLSIGADAYISKPFKEELLIVQIDNLIESRKKLSEAFSSGGGLWEEKIADLSMDKKLVEKALRIVHKNMLNENFSVESLAAEIGLSRTHLHRKLKTITNQSASEFIRNTRLEKAKELMSKGELKINEIGFAVGFNSHTYFTKSFKKYVGLSPQEYLKSKR